MTCKMTIFEVPFGNCRCINISGIDCRREPLRSPVGDSNGILEIFGSDDRNDGSKNLLLSNPHLRKNIPKDSRLDEISLRAFTFAAGLSPQDELCSFFFSDFDIFENFFELRFIDHGPNVGFFLKPITKLESRGSGLKGFSFLSTKKPTTRLAFFPVARFWQGAFTLWFPLLRLKTFHSGSERLWINSAIS